MSTMRAKMYVSDVIVRPQNGNQETVKFHCVSDKPFGPNGDSEDNTFARYSPAGSMEITINNPALHGKFILGQKFYLDFTESDPKRSET